MEFKRETYGYFLRIGSVLFVKEKGFGWTLTVLMGRLTLNLWWN